MKVATITLIQDVYLPLTNDDGDGWERSTINVLNRFEIDEERSVDGWLVGVLRDPDGESMILRVNERNIAFVRHL